MSKYKDPDSWKYRGVKRRDFRAAHDEPEEMPHRKRGYGKIDKSKCDHEWSDWKIVRSHYNWYDVDPDHIRRYNSESKHRYCKKCHKRDYEYKHWMETVRKLNSPGGGD